MLSGAAARACSSDGNGIDGGVVASMGQRTMKRRRRVHQKQLVVNNTSTLKAEVHDSTHTHTRDEALPSSRWLPCGRNLDNKNRYEQNLGC